MTYPSVLINNAYNILGLDGSAPSNEVKKRAQLLLQLAKINEIERFETDIGNMSQIRKAAKIREAQEKLSGIRERLHETFFWFEIQTIKDRNLLKLLAQKKHQQAIESLEKSTKADWLAQKNLALILMFTAFFRKDGTNSTRLALFQRSLEIWKKIIDSDTFWNFYQKYYLLHEEIGTSKSLFCEFRNEITKVLSKLSAEFFKQTRDPKILRLFYELFGNLEASLDSEVLQPLVSKIKESVSEIYTHAKSSQSRKKSHIKALLEKLENQYVELCEYGLYEYSPIAILKNDVAEQLRSSYILVHNEDHDYDLAISLSEYARKFASSQDVLNQILDDKAILLAHKEIDNTWSPKIDNIQTLINENKFAEAYQEYLALDNTSSSQKTFWKNHDRVNPLLVCCHVFLEKGKDLMEKELYSLAADALYYPFELLLDRLQLSEFYSTPHRQEKLKKFLAYLTQNAESCESEKIDMLFSKVQEEADHHEDEDLKRAVTLLGTVAIHRALCKRIKTAKVTNIWKWICWGAVILFFIIKNS